MDLVNALVGLSILSTVIFVTVVALMYKPKSKDDYHHEEVAKRLAKIRKKAAAWKATTPSTTLDFTKRRDSHDDYLLHQK